MKAIICIFYRSRSRPGRYGEFVWMHEHECYVWKGRTFNLDSERDEFHELSDRILAQEGLFPKPTIRLLEADRVASTDLASVPIADLIEAYRLRSREAKVYQLAQARAEKKAKNAPAVAPVEDLEPALAD